MMSMCCLYNVRIKKNDVRLNLGEGEAPETLFVAVEQSLRNFGGDPKVIHQPYPYPLEYTNVIPPIQAMGKFAMDSETEWVAVLIWRKRECYISFARYYRKMKPYAKYQHFKWSDYTSRSRMIKTFNNRHAMYTDGRLRLEGLEDPPQWAQNVNNRVGLRSKKTATTTSENSHQKPTESAAAASAATGPAKEWDSENESWVE